MSYDQRGVTAIEDLPNLEDLEPHRGDPVPVTAMIRERPGPNGQNMEQYQKYIRTNSPSMTQSGMRMEGYGPIHTGHHLATYNLEGYGPPNPGMQHATLQPREMYMSPPEPKIIPQLPMGPDPLSISCIDIARHIQDCPICSKFYNNDRTVYVIAIVVLSIVCLLLLKRVLNV